MRKLTTEEEEIAYVRAISGVSYTKIAKELGFTNDMAFLRYRRNNPSFDKELSSARLASCEHYEDIILDIPNTTYDPQMARVKLETITRVLGYRMPERYGQKIDLNVTQTLDLSGVLVAAQARLPPAERDVTQITNDVDDLL